MKQLEDDKASNTAGAAQPALFSMQTPQHESVPEDAQIRTEILSLSPDQMTPLEALAKLYDLQRLAEQGRNGASDA